MIRRYLLDAFDKIFLDHWREEAAHARRDEQAARADARRWRRDAEAIASLLGQEVAAHEVTATKLKTCQALARALVRRWGDEGTWGEFMKSLGALSDHLDAPSGACGACAEIANTGGVWSQKHTCGRVGTTLNIESRATTREEQIDAAVRAALPGDSIAICGRLDRRPPVDGLVMEEVSASLARLGAVDAAGRWSIPTPPVRCPSCGSDRVRPDTDDCKHFVCGACAHAFTPPS